MNDHRQIDKTVHEPVRLVLLIYLNAQPEATFNELLKRSGVSRGNLSSHLTKLSMAGLIAIEKSFEGNMPLTRVRIRQAGKDRLLAYWETMMGLIG